MRSRTGRGVVVAAVGLAALVGVSSTVNDGGQQANELIDTTESVGTNGVESTGNLGRTLFREGGSLFHTGADELGGVAARSAGALGAGAGAAAAAGGAAATDGATRAPTVGGG